MYNVLGQQSSTSNDEAGSGRKIHTALVAVNYAAHHQASLRAALSPAEVVEVSWSDKGAVNLALQRADVAIIPGPVDRAFLAAPDLSWVHCDASGIESSARPEIFERGLVVTGSAGRSAPVLAEHALFLTLSLIYDSPSLLTAQRDHLWRGVPGYEQRTGLFGKTMGVVGLGATGLAVAKLAKALNMRVLGYRRHDAAAPPNVDCCYSSEHGDDLRQLLTDSDVVVLATRLTDETYHLIGEEQLAAMKPTAYLINMARGAIVDETALAKVLYSRRIAGAGLDTFVQEPLPAESPLWDAPNVVITPHITPEMPDFQGECLRIISENIRRYRAGEPLLNALVRTDVYTKSRKG